MPIEPTALPDNILTLSLKKADPPKSKISCAGASAEYSAPDGRKPVATCDDRGLSVYIPSEPPAAPPNR